MSDEARWFHIMLSTYGSWLYGDSRGFRTRHHREHVEGDYKQPPAPETYRFLELQSRKSLKQPPVVLAHDWRAIIGAAVRDRMQQLGANVLSISCSGQHVHLQAKLPPDCPRAWSGHAKRHAWFEARKRGWTDLLWGKRSKAVPINDREHQENVYFYILDHIHEGAWIWSALKCPPVATGGL
jgi:hypothetical protein